MSALTALTQRLRSGHDITPEEVRLAAFSLAGDHDGDEVKADFLTALSTKKETPVEVAAFAAAFRDMSLDPGVTEWAPRAIDVCGTGGDRSGTFNISTATTFVLAAAGVPVFKHGNRSITSKCGSADLLEALGVRLDAPALVQRRALEQLGFCFFFAPAYHPAFRAIAPVRKALAARGQRSIFNLLGPLINPGRPAFQLLGVFSAAWVDPLGEVLGRLGLARALVVHGVLTPESGLDECTSATPVKVAGGGELASVRATWAPEDFGVRRAALSELAGGDVKENLAIFDAVLAGTAPQGLVDTLCLNSGVALLVAGKVAAVPEGIARARELLLDGAVARLVAATREFYANASA